MGSSSSTPPTFSPRRKWSVGFNVTLMTCAVFLVLVAINYISNQHFSKRFYLSTQTRIELSPRTVSLLESLTNQVHVTVYFDKSQPLYGEIMDLLREYQAHTRKISVKTVDYYLDPGGAQEMKLKYDLGSATNKDFVIFDSEGRKGFVDGSWLAGYKFNLEPSTNKDDPKLYLNRKRTTFNGEMLFSAKIFAVTQPKPLKAYFLQGHGERSPDDTSDIEGYSKLAEIFHRNYVQTETLDNLFSTNSIPQDCNLLVIAGPKNEFQTVELDKISQYLDQGGRLFALFDVYSAQRQLGLEKVLAKWNVRVSHSVVSDPAYAINESENRAFFVSALAVHDLTRPLIGSRLEVVMPRPIERIKEPSQAAADEPRVTELAFSSTNSVLADNPASVPRPHPLITAVERPTAKGLATERGTTRMLITGDSLFLDNQLIDVSVNQDFAEAAVNWLLERTTLLAGVGSRPVTEYRLLMNPGQVTAVKAILLGAIPSGILLLGGVVWLRRRK